MHEKTEKIRERSETVSKVVKFGESQIRRHQMREKCGEFQSIRKCTSRKEVRTRRVEAVQSRVLDNRIIFIDANFKVMSKLSYTKN